MCIGIEKEENFYGHLKRFHWILSHTKSGEKCLEVGCGTGSYITTPLILNGRDAYGCDIGKESIIEAKRIARLNGIQDERYVCSDISNINDIYDVVICSEVLEHINNIDQVEFVNQICDHVNIGGKLIITVPNGKGSYEIGQKYFKIPVEKMEECLRKASALFHKLVKSDGRSNVSISSESALNKARLSITDSPHIQWFRKKDILDLIIPKGFYLEDFTGSAMFSGILINTFMKPNKNICIINNRLGDMFPNIASGYYFCFVKNGKKTQKI